MSHTSGCLQISRNSKRISYLYWFVSGEGTPAACLEQLVSVFKETVHYTGHRYVLVFLLTAIHPRPIFSYSFNNGVCGIHGIWL